METKFTKGEWSILPIENSKEYIRIRGTSLGGKYKIANVIDLKEHHDNSNWCARDRSESLANAHLIKTAAKLYKMLEELISNEDSNLTFNKIMLISELLAEARGE